ncbi:hypothetical protein HZA86_02720 [Candidatus Uhrbacteria bacterium]|nr:hypothetical protein [Candidatus Uhrbacteria bacterium]
MKTTSFNVKLDPKVKREAQRAAEDLGFSLSTYVNASLKQLIRKRSVHFTTGFTMTPYLEDIIAEVEIDHRRGRYAGPFSTIKEMDEHLDSL